MASGNTVWLDDNAAGWGWFIDPTPWDDAEFTTPGDQGEQYRMNLLTALVHEVGHLLGHDHDEGGALAETLAPSEQWAPNGVYVGSDIPGIAAPVEWVGCPSDRATGRRTI